MNQPTPGPRRTPADDVPADDVPADDIPADDIPADDIPAGAGIHSDPADRPPGGGGGTGRDQTATRVTALEDRVEDLASGLDAFEKAVQSFLVTAASSAVPDATTADSGPDAAAESGAGGAGLDMRVLITWVRDNIALLLERRIPQSGGWPHWCQMWWQHPEAIARFEAVRRVWLEAAGQSTGAGLVIYFEHLDQQLTVLCGENGPFCGCTGGRHQPDTTARVLGQIDPDEDYYLDLELGDSSPPSEPPTVWIDRASLGAQLPAGDSEADRDTEAHEWGPPTTASNGHRPGEPGRW